MTFQGKGLCMFPTIRPGDVLALQMQDLAQIQCGMVIVFRREKALWAHRVVGICHQSGGAYLRTQSDRSPGPDAQKVYAADLLGVVTEIRRGDQTLSPEKRPWQPRHRLQFRFHCLAERLQLLFWNLAERILENIQKIFFYQSLGKCLLSIGLLQISFELRLPVENGHHPSLFQRFPESAFPSFPAEILERAKKKGILWLRINGTPAVSYFFSEAVPLDQRIFVRRRFRHLDLESRLLEKARRYFWGRSTYWHSERLV